MDRHTLLSVKGLEIGYGKNKIIGDIKFELHSGEIAAVMGPNGVGKSTLLRALSGLLPPISGKVLLDNRDIYSGGRDNLKRNARQISILTTAKVDAELMSVSEVVESGRYMHSGIFGRISDADREKAKEIIHLVGLDAIKDAAFSKLSDGQKQRVMLGRAICKEPELLVMDEPLTFLDIKYKQELIYILKSLAHKANIGIIISLHEPEDVRKLADRVLTLKDGGMKDFLDGTDKLNENYIKSLFDLAEISNE